MTEFKVQNRPTKLAFNLDDDQVRRNLKGLTRAAFKLLGGTQPTEEEIEIGTNRVWENIMDDKIND